MPTQTERTRADEGYRDLRALEAIEQNPHISQRELARDMGVALGVANACVRTLVRKGLIKIRGESNRSITYHVTKQGRVQKARLAMEWTGNTIDFYVQARNNIARVLGSFAESGVRAIAVFGADEAAELVALLAGHAGITIAAVIAQGDRRIADELLGVPVVALGDVCDERADLVLACVEPTAEEVAALRERFPGAPITMLNGRILEEGTR